MAKTVAVIMNPISGSARLTGTIHRIVRPLAAEGLKLRIHQTQGQGHGLELARQLARSADILLVVGGDGTVREVAAGALHTGTPLAVFPSGTENILARLIGAKSDPRCLVRTLTGGRSKTTDVGVINGNHFLVVVGVGFDAEVVARLVRARAGHITHLSYFWPIWRTFWEHRFPLIRVVADGREVFHGQGLVFVGNMKRYAANLRLLRDAVDDDGLLDLCIYPCRWQGKLLLHAANTLLRRHVEHGGVIYRKCKRITVTSAEAVPLEADGDLGGTLPAEIEVIPRAATFLLPPQ